MEDRRTAFAILAIIFVVLFYSEYALSPATRPTAPVQSAAPVTNSAGANSSAPIVQATAAPSVSTTLPETVTPTAPTTYPSTPDMAQLEASPVTIIETEEAVISLVHLGGRIRSFQLKQYLDHLGDPKFLDMLIAGNEAALPLGVYVGNLNDSSVNYTVTSSVTPHSDGRVSVSGDQQLVVHLNGQLPDGNSIEKTLTFQGNKYVFTADVKLGRPTSDGSKIWLEWTHYLTEELAHNRLDPWTFSILTDANKVRHIPLTEVANTLSNPFATKWVGFADKYFTSLLISPEEGSNTRIGKNNTTFIQRVAGQMQGGQFQLFIGPKDYRVLTQSSLALERSIDLGFFSFLAYPLLVLIRLLHGLFNNYGLAIVALTLSIKGIFFPLTRASLRSMKAMSALQPEMKALRERISDPTQLNQEMMALYKKRGVNPLGGCLPILIQIPVFFGLYSALLHSIELRHAPFALWINDLSSPERLVFFGVNFPVMIILMGLAMFYQQWSTPMPTVDPAQRRMMLWISAIFPISFLIFPFPSGLALYMLTNTSISLIQQGYLRNDKHTHPGFATAVASLGIFGFAFVLTLL